MATRKGLVKRFISCFVLAGIGLFLLFGCSWPHNPMEPFQRLICIERGSK